MKGMQPVDRCMRFLNVSQEWRYRQRPKNSSVILSDALMCWPSRSRGSWAMCTWIEDERDIQNIFSRMCFQMQDCNAHWTLRLGSAGVSDAEWISRGRWRNLYKLSKWQKRNQRKLALQPTRVCGRGSVTWEKEHRSEDRRDQQPALSLMVCMSLSNVACSVNMLFRFLLSSPQRCSLSGRWDDHLTPIGEHVSFERHHDTLCSLNWQRPLMVALRTTVPTAKILTSWCVIVCCVLVRFSTAANGELTQCVVRNWFQSESSDGVRRKANPRQQEPPTCWNAMPAYEAENKFDSNERHRHKLRTALRSLTARRARTRTTMRNVFYSRPSTPSRSRTDGCPTRDLWSSPQMRASCSLTCSGSKLDPSLQGTCCNVQLCTRMFYHEWGMRKSLLKQLCRKHALHQSKLHPADTWKKNRLERETRKFCLSIRFYPIDGSWSQLL